MELEVYPFPLQWSQISYFYDYATDNKFDLVELLLQRLTQRLVIARTTHHARYIVHYYESNRCCHKVVG